jgi:hypothetical protein
MKPRAESLEPGAKTCLLIIRDYSTHADPGAEYSRRSALAPRAVGLGSRGWVFCHVLSSFVKFCRVVSSPVEFCQVLSISVELCRVMSSFVEFCRVLSSFVEFSRVSSSSVEFCLFLLPLVASELRRQKAIFKE